MTLETAPYSSFTLFLLPSFPPDARSALDACLRAVPVHPCRHANVPLHPCAAMPAPPSTQPPTASVTTPSR